MTAGTTKVPNTWPEMAGDSVYQHLPIPKIFKWRMVVRGVMDCLAWCTEESRLGHMLAFTRQFQTYSVPILVCFKSFWLEKFGSIPYGNWIGPNLSDRTKRFKSEPVLDMVPVLTHKKRNHLDRISDCYHNYSAVWIGPNHIAHAFHLPRWKIPEEDMEKAFLFYYAVLNGQLMWWNPRPPFHGSYWT